MTNEDANDDRDRTITRRKRGSEGKRGRGRKRRGYFLTSYYPTQSSFQASFVSLSNKEEKRIKLTDQKIRLNHHSRICIKKFHTFNT